MPDIKFATADVAAMKLGTANVTKVMLGTVEVWPGVVCTDVLTEPFNNFTAAPWTLTGTPTIVAGRTGTAAQFNGTTARADYTIPPAAESDYLTIGFAWKATVSGGSPRIFGLWSDTNATEHIRVVFDLASGQVAVTRAGANLGTTPGGTIAINTWYYIELQVRLHDTAGSAVLRVNGVDKINIPAIDTKNAGTKATFDTVRLGPLVTTITTLYDDLYLSTGAGCTFQGDHTIAGGGGAVIGSGCSLLTEPFDNFAVWTTGGDATIVTGRTGTAARLGSATGFATYSLPVGDQSDILIAGFAFRWSAAVVGIRPVFEFRSDTGATLHNRLRLDEATGALIITRGVSTALGTSAAGVVPVNTWAFIEVRMKLGDSPNGQATVRVNGTDVITVTGADTKAAGTKTVYDQVQLFIGTSAGTQDYDDLYLSTGSACSFKGDHTIP